MACIFGHKWDGCKCKKCGKVRDEGHNYQVMDGKCSEKCSICGKTRELEHKWKGCMCERCGQTRPHKWNNNTCVQCGKTRVYSEPTNLVVVAMYPTEGEIDRNDGAIVNKAAALASYAVSNEFILSPAFNELNRKYSSLRGVDHIIFGPEVTPHGDIVRWLATQTGESENDIEASAWSKLFEMTGKKQIKDGVWARFSIISYFFIP